MNIDERLEVIGQRLDISRRFTWITTGSIVSGCGPDCRALPPLPLLPPRRSGRPPRHGGKPPTRDGKSPTRGGRRNEKKRPERRFEQQHAEACRPRQRPPLWTAGQIAGAAHPRHKNALPATFGLWPWSFKKMANILAPWRGSPRFMRSGWIASMPDSYS